MSSRIAIIGGIVLVAILATGGWLYATAGQESTDDAQVDAQVIPIAARVGGTVASVPVVDNQAVDAGTILLELDRRTYEIAVERAKAELADAQAAAAVAQANVPILSTTASSGVITAQGSVDNAEGGIEEATRGIDAAKARLTTAQAHLRETEANATRTARDVERLKGLLDKDEVSQQQFDAATAAADAARAASDSARSQVSEAELAIRISESRLMQARAGADQASAQLRMARTAPDQVTAARARAAAAAAHVQQMEAMLKQAELDLEHATVKAPVKGVVSRKSVEPGQVIQPGQPLMTVIPLERVWVTANFKETQLEDMRPDQRVRIRVDAYGGREFSGHLQSVAAATGARFSLIPPDNATGNFVKVVQRVPVRIAIDEAQDPEQLLRPGLSVDVTVFTK